MVKGTSGCQGLALFDAGPSIALLQWRHVLRDLAAPPVEVEQTKESRCAPARTHRSDRDQKAHDGGEFFTPVSLVSLIAHVLDPACGSDGMFVQSARTVEEHGGSPTERLTFRGLEKNATTIHLAKMNLAVHGLEGDIRKAITYYEDPHELLGKADYVMANPPFNVDETDAGKVSADPHARSERPQVLATTVPAARSAEGLRGNDPPGYAQRQEPAVPSDFAGEADETRSALVQCSCHGLSAWYRRRYSGLG